MANSLKERLALFLQDDSGQDMIEYVLIATLIALGSIAATKTLSNNLSNAFTNIGTSVGSNV